MSRKYVTSVYIFVLKDAYRILYLPSHYQLLPIFVVMPFLSCLNFVFLLPSLILSLSQAYIPPDQPCPATSITLPTTAQPLTAASLHIALSHLESVSLPPSLLLLNSFFPPITPSLRRTLNNGHTFVLLGNSTAVVNASEQLASLTGRPALFWIGEGPSLDDLVRLTQAPQTPLKENGVLVTMEQIVALMDVSLRQCVELRAGCAQIASGEIFWALCNALGWDVGDVRDSMMVRRMKVADAARHWLAGRSDARTQAALFASRRTPRMAWPLIIGGIIGLALWLAASWRRVTDRIIVIGKVL